jgi:hypothetical protein
MRKTLFALSCLLLATPAIADLAPKTDEAAIRAAVLDYFHGQGQGSIDRLNRAFAVEQASMVGVMRADDGKESLRAWKDMREPLANWSKEPNPAAPDRDGEILGMQVTDGRIATVTFRSTDRFYDALTLVKIDGEWKIVAKVFVRQ